MLANHTAQAKLWHHQNNRTTFPSLIVIIYKIARILTFWIYSDLVKKEEFSFASIFAVSASRVCEHCLQLFEIIFNLLMF